MPKFEVTGPDGHTYELDAPDEQSAASAFRKFMGADAPKQEQPAGPAWSTQSLGNYVTGLMSNLNQDIPFVGRLDDEMRAGFKALPALLDDRSFADEYARHKGENVAQVETFQRERPYEAAGARVAGGLLGGGAMATTKPGQLLLGGGGQGFLDQIGRSVASGAGMGYAAGYGSGEGGLLSPDRFKEAESSAKWGGAIGGAIPVAARAVGSGVRAISERNALPQSMGPAAGRFMTEAAEADTGAAQRLAQLGDEATLADAGPSFLGLSQGIAVTPGQGKSTIVDALTTRQRGANQRLARDTGQTIGQAQTPSQIDESLVAARRGVTRPLYQGAFLSSGPVNPQSVITHLDRMMATERGQALDALRNVRGMFTRTVYQGGFPRTVREDRAEALHNAKEAIDDMIGSLQAKEGSGARSAVRALTSTRNRLNGLLEVHMPQYRQANRIYAEYSRQIEALQDGARLLDGGKNALRPDELAERMRTMSAQERSALRAGLRAELDRLTGTTANDLSALRKAVLGEGDWNRDKLRLVFGRRAADDLIASVEREGAFANTYGKVVENSQTAQRTAAAKKLGPRDPQRVDMGMTATGLASRVAQEGGLWGVRQLRGRSRANRNQELAEMLMLSGPQRDGLLQELHDSIFAQGQAANTGNRAAEIVRSILMRQVPEMSVEAP